jgi:hypothetical protein
MIRFVTLLVVLSSVAQAQVFTWTDKDGVAHFTDNPNSVPSNVKAKVTSGQEISTVTPSTPKPVAAPAPATVSGATAPPDTGRAEREWRDAFREANERIARLEDEIEADRKKVEDVNGLPVSARYQCLNGFGSHWRAPLVAVPGGPSNAVAMPTPCFFALNPEFERAKERLELNRKALTRARAALTDLERRAGFEAVPHQWRR